MSKAKHTPTPWHWHKTISLDSGDGAEIHTQYDANNHYVVAKCCSHLAVLVDEAIANAEFIVRAVNCHDRFVAAAKDLVENGWHAVISEEFKEILEEIGEQ